MEQTLRKIVSTIAEVEPSFDPNASFRDVLDVDSIRALEIMFEIEQNFNCSIEPEEYTGVDSLADLMALISNHSSFAAG